MKRGGLSAAVLLVLCFSGEHVGQAPGVGQSFNADPTTWPAGPWLSLVRMEARGSDHDEADLLAHWPVRSVAQRHPAGPTTRGQRTVPGGGCESGLRAIRAQPNQRGRSLPCSSAHDNFVGPRAANVSFVHFACFGGGSCKCHIASPQPAPDVLRVALRPLGGGMDRDGSRGKRCAWHPRTGVLQPR